MLKELWLTWILVSGLGESATTNTQGTTNLTVVIDGYTVNSTLTSPATLPLGRTALLVCRVSGIPHGQQTSYQWTCPNQRPCVEPGYARRKINNIIIAINTTSTSDGGTYTCTVTAGGMEGRQDFRIIVAGGAVAHSYGRLLVNEEVITNRRQLQPPDNDGGGGRIECTNSSGISRLGFAQYRVDSGNTQKATAVIPREDLEDFTNIEGSCGNAYLYLFLKKTDEFPQVRSLTLQSASTHSITANLMFDSDSIARVITGYHRLDLGHEMVGQFHNNGLRTTVTFSALVPGARYRITAWGLGGGDMKKRGSAPAVLEFTTQPSAPSLPRALTITRVFEDGIELNWLPPRENHGDILHYIIRYTLQNGTAQEITTTDNTNYYNLTGLERVQTYYNFTVKAVNLAHTSAKNARIKSYTKPDPPTTATTTRTTSTTQSTATAPGNSKTISSPTQTPPNSTIDISTDKNDSTGIIAGAGIGVVAVLAGVLLAVTICCIVSAMRRRKKNNANSTVQTDTTPHCSTDREQEHVYTTFPGDHKPVVSFTPGALYDEVEISAQPTPVAVPSEYQLVDSDKEEDGEGKWSTSITNPEDFYAQPDKKGKKRQDPGDYELPEQHIPNPDCLYSSVKKNKKNKSDKKVEITEGPKLGQQSMLYEEVDRTQKMKTKHPHNIPPQDNAIYAEVNKPKKKKGKKKGEASEENNGTQELGDLVPTVPPRGNDLGYEPSADSKQ